jgi:Domain of unknown function (DUF5916)/Carbohydrate family 9 binding domain-like
MKYFYAILFIFLSFNFIQAQTIAEAGTEKSNSEASKKANLTTDLSKLKREPIVIPKIAVPPVIDGKVDDEIWKQAKVIRDFIQTNPGDHIPASKQTEAYIAYDEQNFYIAFKCWDEKDKIRATVVQRDQAFGEDNVRFWLDTYDDQRRAYVIGVNPLGIQQDGINTENGGTDFNVDILMESKGVIEDWGWSAEIKVPFKSLRYTAGKGKFWGFNAARNIDRLNDEFDSWVPLPRETPGFLTKFGKLTGLDEIKTERTFEIIPTFTAKQTGNLIRTNIGNTPLTTKFSNPPIKADFGFTAKYQITPNVTLDAAYNPDFADTEADAPVVEANQRFPIFFQEKRPFFLEGVDIFRTQLQAVYTRRIKQPDVAVKLTGKIGKNSFGVFTAYDQPSGFSKDKAIVGVVRLKRDIGKESNVGFLATSYNYPEQRNQVAGFDGSWKINKNTQISGQILGSTSRNYFYNPNTNEEKYRTGNGFSYTFEFNKDKKNTGYGFGSNGTTKDYRSDVGFTRRQNTTLSYVYLNLNSDPKPKAFIIRKNFHTDLATRYDFQGRSQGTGLGLNMNLSLKGNAEIGFGGNLSRENIYEDEFGPKRKIQQNPQGQREQRGAFYGNPRRAANQASFFAYGYKQINKRFSLNGSGNLNFNGFDFDGGGGNKFQRVSPAALAAIANCARIPRPLDCQEAPLDPGTAKEFSIDFGAEVKPTDKFNLEMGFNKNELRRNDTKLLVYISNIATFRSTYQFSRFVNIKARLDYNTLNGRLFGQYTFGWTPSPGKALYVGYNDSSNYKGYVFGNRQDNYQQLNRTFFIKLSYLFRKSF